MTIAVSSWALHKTIGTATWDAPERRSTTLLHHAAPSLDLLDLPARLQEHGFNRLELCHFHLPRTDAAYLAEFREALGQSKVVLQTLLIDDGDLTDPGRGDRDRDWIAEWVDTAAELGAEGARVIAGMQPWSEEAAARSASGLESLTGRGPRIRIENWYDLLRTPEHVHELLDRLEGTVGLCLDFGNWSGPTKYEDLAAIAGRAETCHAKSEFVDAGTIDEDDYSRCIDLARAAGYRGPYVIVNGGRGGSEWNAIKLQVDFLEAREAACSPT